MGLVSGCDRTAPLLEARSWLASSDSVSPASASAWASDTATSDGCRSRRLNAIARGTGAAIAGGRNVAIVNNTNITNVYRNARFSGAVTGLRAGDFGRVGVGRNAFVRPNSTDLARAGVVSGGMPFAPARRSSGRNYGSAGGGAVGGARFDNSRSNLRLGDRPGNVVRLDSPSNNGGWRRLESQPGAPAVGGNRPDVRTFSPQRSAPQPVRISPPIVNNRFESQSNRTEFGNFGGPRPAGFWRASRAAGGSGEQRATWKSRV